MKTPHFSLPRWRWLLIGIASAIALIGLGLLLYQSTQEGDPYRTVRESYAQQQGGAVPSKGGSSEVAKVPPLSNKEGEERKSSPEEEIRKLEAIPLQSGVTPLKTVSPPLEMKSGIQERKVVEMESIPAPVFEEPVIPQALLDQTPPSKNKEETSKVSIAPARYRFNNLSPDAVLGNVVVTEDHSSKDFNLDTFAPEMEDIDLALMDHINSSSLELDVAAGVWTPFYFQGRKLLEVGDKLRGQASPGRQRDRLVVRFTKVIKKDGRSLPIQGISLAQDGTLGIPGEKVGNIFQAAAGPLLAELIKGVSESFQDREKGIVSGTGSAVATDLPARNLKNAGIRGSQRVLDKIEELMTEELEENKPYLFVRAGTRLRCRLQVAVDVSQADYGK